MKGYLEESTSEKLYDRSLMRRLFGYLRPYRKYFIIGLISVIIISGFEVLLPYITKYGIDEYINPSIKIIDVSDYPELNEAFLTQYKELTIAEEEGKILIKSYDIDNLLPEHYSILQTNNLISQEFYATFPISPETDSIATRYPELFTQYGDLYVLAQNDLEKISVDDTRLLRSDDLNGLKILAIIFLSIIIIRFILNYLQIYVLQFAGVHSMYDLRMKLFGHLQKLPLSFFDKNPIGRLVTRVTNDIEVLAELLSEGLITILRDIFVMGVIFAAMLLINWQLALITFLVLPLIILFMVRFRKAIRRVYRAVRVKLAKINATMSENLSGILTTQLFNQEKNKSKEFSQVTKEYYKAEKRQLRVFALFRPLVDVMVHLAIALIIWYGGGQIISNRMSLGVLVLFISYVHRFFEPLYDLSQKYNILQSAMAALEKIFTLMDEKPEDYMGEIPSLKITQGKVELKNVWLAYNDDEYVLKNIDLNVEPGEKVALVGETGAGKTSIIKLINRFYEFQKGDILIDDVPISNYSLEELRKNIGVVQQDVFIFSGSVKDNIRLYNPYISDDMIIQAAKYVNADKFIEKLPNRYDEKLKERGSMLSAGQRQLIALARVIATNPRIFILDEATSNIDTETEILIQDALEKVMKNRTSIVIAHRLSTIQNMDRIVVIHKGEIIEEGNHQELLHNHGFYYKLYRIQYKDQAYGS
jgi:ATP-binding cassette subfamily B protein/subfamily B ATP-binding cassette protein MsbA